MANRPTLLVVDAHAMAYRAYFALQNQNLTNDSGQVTTAIFGFFRMLFKVLKDLGPEMTAVTWDASGGSFRNRMYDQYKAQRKPMPDDLRYQIDEIKELLEKAGFQNLLVQDFEADDLMGSLAKRYGAKQTVVLLTGDKDCYQLLNKNVKMLRGSRGVTEFIEIDPDWVKRELGVSVQQIPDYMALIGDSSDNIPGAKGIGPKSAEKLIQDYGDIETIYKKLDEIKPDGVRKKLEASRDDVFLSKELATIKLDVDEIQKLKDDTIATPDYLNESVLKLFLNQGYNAIYKDLQRARANAGTDAVSGGGEKAESSDPESEGKSGSGKKGSGETKATKSGGGNKDSGASGRNYTLINSEADLKKLASRLKKIKTLAVDTETTSLSPMFAALVGVSVCAKKEEAYYIAIKAGDDLFSAQGEPALDLSVALPYLKEFLENPDCRYIGQNIKYDYLILKRHGITLPSIYFDTMIASYLANPNVRRHNLDDLAFDHLGIETIKYAEIAGSGKKQVTLDQVDPASIRDYACEDADVTYQLYQILEKDLKKANLRKIHDEIECRLIPVLAGMEEVGVAIDEKYFAKLSKDYAKKLEGFEKSIHEEAGYEFNINSTKELQTLLFEKLNLPKGKKTKTGYSTDQSVLEELRGHHPIIDALLEHRKYSKLKSTYVDTLPRLIHPETGRIHTSFQQTIAATGRLSSTDPNLQNIPIREQTGRAIRRGFVPAKGNILLALDYSQIELRILAHYAKDEALLDAFKNDKDIHAMTAASLFGVQQKDVSPDQRSQAKTVNFSIVYGVTDFGLSRNLGIGRKEAQELIDLFFETYPGVRRYMDDTIAFAEKHGYVETLSGRKRQIPEINASNRFRKEGARRTAINTPIQGTSADIIKMAMISIQEKMQKKKFKSAMILQVHDELLFDARPEEKDDLVKLATREMESAIKLDVPLRVDAGEGKNWDEAH
ncbi:MAG: DNA polymerase I [Spirochaetaceae bacterium]|nr:DNA polymerase I [Spirochaetaceae bacterium]|tara:strand:- start:51292 stop:54141 length:2850 start_codon:yes stop_codon:yes gene_type:complete